MVWKMMMYWLYWFLGWGFRKWWSWICLSSPEKIKPIPKKAFKEGPKSKISKTRWSRCLLFVFGGVWLAASASAYKGLPAPSIARGCPESLGVLVASLDVFVG